MYNHPNLHSKLYFNENKMIVASLNMNQLSMMNSFEVGWLTNKYDAFDKMKKYVKETIIKDKLTSPVVQIK